MYVILVYDISTCDKAGQRRLNKIFKLCKQYLCHVQKSVFEGEITKAKLEELKIRIQVLVDDEFDSIIIFKNREQKWLDKEILGLQEDKTDNFL
jgi:CRISPR-associated protein Cas2